MRNGLRGLVGVVAFLLLWELFGRSGIVLREFLPPPSDVLIALGRMLAEQQFLRGLLATVLAWLLAVGVAVGIAIPAGLLLGTIPLLRVATGSVIEFLRPIPAIALLPVVVMLLGSGPSTKITLAAYAAIWPMLFNVIYALSEVDPQYVDTARSFGLSRWQIVLKVKFPDVFPFALTGLRIAATFALLVIVSLEFIGGAMTGRLGLGNYVMERGEAPAKMDVVLAGALIAGVWGYLINAGLSAAGRRLAGWSPAVRAA